MSEITEAFTVYRIAPSANKRMFIYSGEMVLIPKIGFLSVNQTSASPYSSMNTYTNTTTFSEAAATAGFSSTEINEVIERYNNE